MVKIGGVNMRKLMTILTAALVMLAAVGCEKNENLPDNSVQGNITLSAVINNGGTKTSLGALNNGEYPVLWSEGDAIAVINNSKLFKFVVDAEDAGSTSGTFTLQLFENCGYTEADFKVDQPVQAIYPFEGVTFDGTAINYAVPAEQTYAAGSFGKGASPMSAYAGNAEGAIAFENLFGAIKLQLKGDHKVTSILVQGKNDEVLSGSAAFTTYTTGTAPAITLTSEEESAKSVSLVCGNGVQLDGSNAVEFIIALPPVNFSNGFKVKIEAKGVNSASYTYNIETGSANNTIIESQILTMPELNPINSLNLSRGSMTMLPGTTYAIGTNVNPSNAAGHNVKWTSSNPSAVTVDQNGNITAVADGESVIRAELALFAISGECQVKVKSTTAVPTKKYVVGENDYGYGIAIGEIVWAPVNCGYEPADGDYKGYPYGKYYQWGRKYGQGYDDNDASYPSGDKIKPGTVLQEEGNAPENADVFFTQLPWEPWHINHFDWCKFPNGNMWRENERENDPCPAGWRIPRYSELENLNWNWQGLTTGPNGQPGVYYYGEYTPIDGAPKIFLPAAGCILPEGGTSDGHMWKRGSSLHYWTSDPKDYTSGSTTAYCLRYHESPQSSFIDCTNRASGFSIRCVQIQE